MKHPIADVNMAHLSPKHMADYRDERLKVIKPNTVIRELAVLSSIINHARREWGLNVINPVTMIKKPSSVPIDSNEQNQQYRYFLIFQQGIIVGILVGLVGAGGGFIIIPALVMFAKLPMKKAVGTSLAIIALNSSIGFLSDFGVHQFDWNFLFVFSAFAVSGILIGSYLSKYVSGAKLKPAFGWFILLMGIYIISKELFLK
jgi:uncharacterized membrane protein YfcA